jgi:hypothetical protein
MNQLAHAEFISQSESKSAPRLREGRAVKMRFLVFSHHFFLA